ncbi:phosphatidylethanolamine binding [Branchiostoma belcheri]|nr:phosphatidylethanolamine binding [Branchiostoma belcheri]
MKLPLCVILPLLLEVSLMIVVTATVESGVIRDDQFSASSSWGSSSWQPWEARLNSGSAWYPRQYSTSEWLQIDLLERMSITGIQTQGDPYYGASYYVTSFKLLYSDDGTDLNWNTFQENGSDKIFEGSSDGDGVKTNTIDPPIVTRFIRLMAVTWERGIAFRLELLGYFSISRTASNCDVTDYRSENDFDIKDNHNADDAKPTSDHRFSAIIGGAVVDGVVIIIMAIAVSIFFIRRRRSKDTDGNESSPRPDGGADRIYNNVIMFTTNGSASNNGHVSIGRMRGECNVTIDQSEETMENNLYAYAGATSGATGESQDMVDNLYADIREGWMEKMHQPELGTSNGVHVNIPPAPSSGEYQELRPAVYQSLQKY